MSENNNQFRIGTKIICAIWTNEKFRLYHISLGSDVGKSGDMFGTVYRECDLLTGNIFEESVTIHAVRATRCPDISPRTVYVV